MNDVTNLIPGLVFIGDQIEMEFNTRYWDWLDHKYDSHLLENWDCVEQFNPRFMGNWDWYSSTQSNNTPILDQGD
jgi:hypothetical protein